MSTRNKIIYDIQDDGNRLNINLCHVIIKPRINYEAQVEIIEMLREGSTTTLCLGRNNITDDEVAAIARIITNAAQLQTLDGNANNVTFLTRGTMQEMEITWINTLTKLDLSHNKNRTRRH